MKGTSNIASTTVPLRILHTVPSLNAEDGGPARSVPALAAAQAEAGADVVVWSQQPATIDLDGFRAARFVSSRLEELPAAGWEPDLMHDHGLWLPSNHVSARFGRHQRIPRVVSPRGMLEPWCLKHHRVRKTVAWRLYQQRDLKSSACLHATSVSEADQFRRLGFLQPVITLPNGVTLPEIDEAETNETGAAANREVLFLSRLHTVKGLENLLAAWKSCQQPGWTLSIVGSGEDSYRQSLIRHAADLGLQSSVSICGGNHSDEKWHLLKRADLVVLPSFSENFGIVVAEALGMGTPVITTTGTPWHQIPEKRCGWYVEPTVDGLIEALHSAMKCSRAELNAMGAKGRRWVRESCAWADIGRNMLSGYRWILGKSHASEAEQPRSVQTVLRPAA